MPAITVETGSGVSNANSYVDLAYLQSYADSRGFVLPQTQEDKEKFLIRATDYLENFRSEYQGCKVAADQSLQWPRKKVYIDGTLIEETVIPEELKKAQCQLVVEQQQRTRLYPSPRTSTSEGFVTQKTVGPLTKKFADSGKGAVSQHTPIRIASVETFLRPLISCGQGWKRVSRA